MLQDRKISVKNVTFGFFFSYNGIMKLNKRRY